MLRRGLAGRELIRRFRSERQILANLDHPHIARLSDGGTLPDGRPYLVMEYVEGEPLIQHCEALELSLSARLELFCKVCRGVHFAHQNLIVHRDLKPQNILVTADGEPRLLDFGIAKPLDPEAFPETVVATVPGHAPMTLRYASPEQIRGRPITTASDIYSLGVILYELLTGLHLYSEDESNSPHEIMRAICESPPERPSLAVQRRSPDPVRHPKALRGDLDNIVLKALRKEARRRYASAEALAQDIERHLSFRPVHARPDTVAYRVGRFVRRNRWGVSAASTVLAVLIGLLLTLAVQRRQVLDQKLRSEEVTRVMIDLFEISDPDLALGETVTAREIMERGAREIPERLPDRPLLRADLLEAIAQVHRKLGLYPDARALFDRVVGLRRQAGAADRRALSATLVRRGDVLSLASDLQEADASYREALDLLDEMRIGDDPVRELGLSGLAAVRKRSGDSQAAETLHRRALAMSRRLFGETAPRTAANLVDLADVHNDGSDHRSARLLYQEARGLYRELYGDDHPKVVGLTSNLAVVAHDLGELDLSERLFRSALEQQRRLYGEWHPSLATTLGNLASLLLDRDRKEEAEELCRKALVMRREAYGGDHPKVAEALNQLGLIHREQGESATAEEIFRQAVGIWQSAGEVTGGRPSGLGVGLANLASILRARGERDEAEGLYREALEISRAVHGDEHTQVAAILHHLGRLARDRGELTAASELYQEALRIRLELLGKDHPKVAETLHNLAVVLRHLDQYERAESMYRDALRIHRDKLGAEHPRVAVTLQSMASVVALQGRYEEAEALARQALEILDPEHIWALAARAVLGSSLAGQGRFAEAEKQLLASYEQLKLDPDAGITLIDATVERLIALYEAWGKAGEAAEYRSLIGD